MAQKKVRSATKAIHRGPKRLPRRSSTPKNIVSFVEALEEIADRPDLFGRDQLDPAAMEIGLELRRARIRRHETQHHIEQLTGIPQSAISDIERGKGKDGPSYRIIRDLGNALDFELALLPKAGWVKGAAYDWLTVSSSTKAFTFVDAVGNIQSCWPIVRSVLSDIALTETKKAIISTLRSHMPHTADIVPVCGFWRQEPQALTCLTSKAATLIVAYNGTGNVKRLHKPNLAASDQVVVVGDKDQVEVSNTGDDPLSLLTIPVTADILEYI